MKENLDLMEMLVQRYIIAFKFVFIKPSYFPAFTGIHTFQGEKGSDGMMGEKGNKGAKGIRGKKGRIVSEIT